MAEWFPFFVAIHDWAVATLVFVLLFFALR